MTYIGIWDLADHTALNTGCWHENQWGAARFSYWQWKCIQSGGDYILKPEHTKTPGLLKASEAQTASISLMHNNLNISKTMRSLNVTDSRTDDEWNMRIVTSLRVNTRGLVIQPLQYIQILHRDPGIIGNKLPISDSGSPSKQLYLCLPLQRWKVIHPIYRQVFELSGWSARLKRGIGTAASSGW